MLLRTDLSKTLANAPTLEDLGVTLRSIDENEQALRIAYENQLNQQAEFLSQIKQEKLNKIKVDLESEKKIHQQTCNDKYEEAIKDTHLTQKQRENMASTLQESLQKYEAEAIRKYGQLVKKLEEEIALSKQNFLDEQQGKFEQEITENDTKRENIKNELRQFIASDQSDRINKFKNELTEKVKAIDNKIAKSVKIVNSNATNFLLDEYKAIDLFLYKTLNDLAQKYLVCRRDELKLALAIRLSQFTDYQLADALKLSEKVVTSLSIQVTNKEKNKISFELIARDIDQEINLNSNQNHFKDVLLAIKEESFTFTSRAEYLFTCYFDAKKREYGNRISSFASDNLLNQDNARRYLQEQALDYLLKHTDPKDFYLTFVNLGIEAMQAKIREKEETHSIDNYNIHHDQVLRELNDKLNETYDNFFIENDISPSVKEKLNHNEIKKVFFQMLTMGYMKHERENVYTLQNKLSAEEVLAKLDEDFEKQKTTFSKQKN